MLKRILLFIIAILFVAGAALLTINYKPDLAVEKLIDKYAFDDSQFLEMEGMKVHYRRTGRGAPLLLIHGFGGNLWNWQDWTRILSAEYEVITLDLPGFGLTGPHPREDYSTEMYLSFLDDFAGTLQLDSFVIAGNSMGGGFAWRYALRHPEKIQKLVLVNSSGYPRQKDEGKMLLGFRLLRVPVINQLVTKITPRSILRKTVRDIYGDPALATEAEVDFYEDILRRKGNRAALVKRMSAPRKDHSGKIRNIDCQTLILWGDQDKLISYRNAHRFRDDIAQAEMIVYPDVGHAPQMEIPEKSASDLRRFLEKQ